MPGLIATGHGMWHIEDGYATVPPGMRVLFFQEPLHLLADEVGQRLERLEPAALANYRDSVEAGRKCRDYSLKHPTALDYAVVPPDHPEFTQIIPAEGQTIKLSDILGDPRYQGHTIYWGACLAVVLKDTGGAFIGVNTGWSGASVPANPGTQSPYLPAEQADAEIRGSDVYRDAVQAVGNARSVEEALYLKTLVRHASPGGANTQQMAALIEPLTSSRDSSAGLAEAFVRLDKSTRRGLLLNDTIKWWLAEHGLHVPGSVTDRVIEIDDPRFWDARDTWVPDQAHLTPHNKRALHELRAGDSEGVWIYGDVVFIGNSHDDPLTVKWLSRTEYTHEATVQLAVVDDHTHWVVHHCAEELRGAVHQALVAAGADSVWFDAPPRAVFDGEDWNEAHRITAESLERLAPQGIVDVHANDQMAVVTDDFADRSADLVQAIGRRDHVCRGRLFSTGLLHPDRPQYRVSGIGADCGCWGRLERVVHQAAGDHVTLVRTD